MPLDIVVKLKPEKRSYAVIGQTGYGRMDEATPADGLATFGASTCTCIVIHCPKLKRTTLIHAPNYLFVKQTMEPIIDWTLGKGEEGYNENNLLEVTALRGYLHRNQTVSVGFNTPGYMTRFMNELRDFIKVTYASHSMYIDDAADPLLKSSNGSFLVDKATAKITVLERPLPCDVYVKISPPAYTQQQLGREIFARDIFPLSYPIKSKIISYRHMQFDGRQYTLHGKISDHCRLVIRAGCSLSYSDEELQRLLMSLGIYIRGIMFDRLKHSITELVAIPGLPCERCSNIALNTCSNCLGAWYCDRTHQREDWREHNRFCKRYALKNA